MSTDLDRLILKGVNLHNSKQFEEAVELYDSALKACPDSMVLWNNRGNSLLEICRYDEAAESYRMALEINPSLHDARIALSTCLQAAGRYNEAMLECDAVLAVASDNPEAHWNRSLLLLQKGEYPEGWREYEWRWQKRGFTSPSRNFRQPCWNGEEITGKTLLVHAEQGFGDTIQFCRYINELTKTGAIIIFECHPPLLSIMKTLHPAIIVVSREKPLPPFDVHVPLLSLPRISGSTLDTVPAGTPYLSAPDGRIPFWQSVIPYSEGLKIGICWAGKEYPDPGRSIPPHLLTPLAAIHGASWFSLQTGGMNSKALPFPAIDMTPLIMDFADTAALLQQLDIVVTIDTSVAHLSGAMGKKTFLMLPFSADWRWLLDRSDSPWYPEMKLFRQQTAGDWRGVLDEVTEEIKTLANRCLSQM